MSLSPHFTLIDEEFNDVICPQNIFKILKGWSSYKNKITRIKCILEINLKASHMLLVFFTSVFCLLIQPSILKKTCNLILIWAQLYKYKVRALN
jgi:hypothetical protein